MYWEIWKIPDVVLGLVFLDPQDERILIPPVGRYINITVCKSALHSLEQLKQKLTCVSLFNGERLPGQLLDMMGPRRFVEMGQMQRPIFDGPVDLRHGMKAELI